MLDLAGEFEAITSYTDGDETDYAREEYYKAIAAHFPERVPGCYAHLIRDEEWRYAEALAIAFAETGQVESRTGCALLESYIVPSEILALEKTSEARPHTKTAIASVYQKTGRAIEAMSDQKETTLAKNLNSIGDDSEKLSENPPWIVWSRARAGGPSFPRKRESRGERRHTRADIRSFQTASESSETEVSVPNPSEFPPERLQEYLNATRDVRPYDHKRKLVTEWLRYWEAAGRAEETLTNLKAATSETRHHLDLDNTLDVAFEISLKAQGRSKAFPWLIRAHVTRSGWQRWFTSSDEAQARMRAVALHYRGQWREFIRNTAKPVFSTSTERNGIVIGLSRLVYFLVEVDELDLAQAYALEMARVFKEKLTEQPIKTPEWSR